ncbi:MAG: ATP-grasp domain-containing protein [Candidatus Saccharimonas sp.]
MNVLEYEAKGILAKFKIPVPQGVVIHQGDIAPQAPTVLKSQVHSGGRGKAGGIRVLKTSDGVAREVKEVFELEIGGEKPSVLLAEEVLDIAHEYYLSLVINRAEASVELIAHQEGGVEVESQVEFGRWNVEYGKWKMEAERIGQALADYYELPGQAFALQDIVESLLSCFVNEDATLIEINPLVLTTEGKLVAGDCKMTLDDDAFYRHKDRKLSETPTSANFVTLDQDGTVATIANGAGLAMATVDAVHSTGLIPANFLDIGGGATVESVVASFRQIVEFPKVHAIVINIFGGIVRCDEVAKAVIEARKQVTNLPTLYIRLTGTNSDIAEQLLHNEGLTLYPTLADCLREITHV